MSSGSGSDVACGDDVVVAVELSELGDEVGADLACGSGYEDFFHVGVSCFHLCVTNHLAPCKSRITLTLALSHRGRGDRSPPLIVREPSTSADLRQHERPLPPTIGASRGVLRG